MLDGANMQCKSRTLMHDVHCVVAKDNVSVGADLVPREDSEQTRGAGGVAGHQTDSATTRERVRGFLVHSNVQTGHFVDDHDRSAVNQGREGRAFDDSLIVREAELEDATLEPTDRDGHGVVLDTEGEARVGGTGGAEEGSGLTLESKRYSEFTEDG